MTDRRRWFAIGGILGPASFVLAWSILGARRAEYSPVHDPISRLAAVGAPTRSAMTVGFVAFAGGVAAYAWAARRTLPRGVAAAAATTAGATLAIAALPLGGDAGDRAHGAAAAMAYVSLAATPLLGARRAVAGDPIGSARASLATGVVVGAALVASAISPSFDGLLQRVGLTVGHLWIASTAAKLLMPITASGRR